MSIETARGDSTTTVPPESVADPGLPFPGYDRLDVRKVVNALSSHSQIELEAVEAYERSHESREAVLDKLRYMRGSEPMPGYDGLTAEEIVSALERADLPTIKKVRGYERKFANRHDVLEAVTRTRRARSAATPATPPPVDQPTSARPRP